MPALEGVLETSLYVDDVERSIGFYRRVFDCEILFQDRRFCALNIAGRQVLLLFKKGATTQAATTPGGIVPGHHGAGELHLAFAIASDALEPWRAQLADQEVPVESEVTWPRGGVSLYFRDPDGHLLELATPGLWTIR